MTRRIQWCWLHTASIVSSLIKALFLILDSLNKKIIFSTVRLQFILIQILFEWFAEYDVIIKFSRMPSKAYVVHGTKKIKDIFLLTKPYRRTTCKALYTRYVALSARKKSLASGFKSRSGLAACSFSELQCHPLTEVGRTSQSTQKVIKMEDSCMALSAA